MLRRAPATTHLLDIVALDAACVHLTGEAYDKTIEIRSAFVFESEHLGPRSFEFIELRRPGDHGIQQHFLPPEADGLPILAGAILLETSMIEISVGDPAKCGDKACGIDDGADCYGVQMTSAKHCTTDPAVIDLASIAEVSGRRSGSGVRPPPPTASPPSPRSTSR